jgi:hypothetical protein
MNEQMPSDGQGEGNTTGTYLKSWIMSAVLGGPLALVLGTRVSFAGLFVGLGVGVWVAGKAFGLEGRGAFVSVYIWTLVGFIVIGFALEVIALSRMGY